MSEGGGREGGKGRERERERWREGGKGRERGKDGWREGGRGGMSDRTCLKGDTEEV